jgi:SOS-response transcriptional repressor LexA
MTVEAMLAEREALDRRVLEILARCDRERRPMPTLRELMDALGTKNDKGISAALDRLEATGYIQREAHKARAIIVLRTK